MTNILNHFDFINTHGKIPSGDMQKFSEYQIEDFMGVRSNAICPGLIQTNMTAILMSDPKKMDKGLSYRTLWYS